MDSEDTHTHTRTRWGAVEGRTAPILFQGPLRLPPYFNADRLPLPGRPQCITLPDCGHEWRWSDSASFGPYLWLSISVESLVWLQQSVDGPCLKVTISHRMCSPLLPLFFKRKIKGMYDGLAFVPAPCPFCDLLGLYLQYLWCMLIISSAKMVFMYQHPLFALM